MLLTSTPLLVLAFAGWLNFNFLFNRKYKINYTFRVGTGVIFKVKVDTTPGATDTDSVD